MSKQFLKVINGGRRGIFADYIESLSETPRIAWYPSAGADFRDLLYLDRRFMRYSPAHDEPDPPELFLHTDFSAYSLNIANGRGVLYDGKRTKVLLEEVEELPQLDLPIDENLVVGKGTELTNRVFFAKLRVESHKFGVYDANLLYACVENTAFCARVAIPNHAVFTHVVKIRYGNSFGGSLSSALWLPNALEKLGCEVYVEDGQTLHQTEADKYIFEKYPDLAGDMGERYEHRLRTIRTIPECNWSHFGNGRYVSWRLVREDREHRERRHWFR